MSEVEALPWNGFNVISTFSGCGGSCLGYRMAGFRVLWANEFIPAAQEVYRKNHPDVYLDTRDIRTVQPSEILAQVGMQPGEVDLFNGSPPCASFSTAGKREAGWGTVKTYSDTKQRTDDLFFQYTRLLRGLMPKTFIAENVSGLVKGTAKGYFQLIMRELKGCGYRVEAKLLNAEWLGVPQGRQRIIFCGVREDLGLNPAFPKPFPYFYSIRDAIPWLDNPAAAPPIEKDAWYLPGGLGREWDRLRLGEQSKRYFNEIKCSPDKPSPTITTVANGARPCHPFERRSFSTAELKRICGFPDDFDVSANNYKRAVERFGRAVPPMMMAQVAGTVRDSILRKLPNRREQVE
jgi:DNA (cytosine-5)-methyltransferase 1